MYCGIAFEVVCGDFGVVCGSLQWFAVFQWTGTREQINRQMPGALKVVAGSRLKQYSPTGA